MPKITTILQNLQTSRTTSYGSAETSFFTPQSDTEPTEEPWNSTINSTDTFNITDIKNAFVDYLTYILNSVLTDFNATDEYSDQSSLNYSSSTTTEDFETFKSSVLPTIFNITDTTTESRFEQEIYSVFDDIASSVSTLKENVVSATSSTSLVSEENSYEQCLQNCEYTVLQEIFSTPTSTTPINISSLSYPEQTKLRTLCWETMFGQELIKLTVMDLIMTVVSTLAIDFFRGIFVRVMNR